VGASITGQRSCDGVVLVGIDSRLGCAPVIAVDPIVDEVLEVTAADTVEPVVVPCVDGPRALRSTSTSSGTCNGDGSREKRLMTSNVMLGTKRSLRQG
jgi:hypothetical protein